jgi:glucose-6-phosphate 1-dehydrogenase
MNVIIFGGTGDLAARKLLPALFRLFKAKKLDGLAKYNNIIGIGSSALSQKNYQETIKKSLQNFLAKEEYDRQNLSEFIKTVSYLQIDFNKPENFKKLA